jgi:hypothetical protein
MVASGGLATRAGDWIFTETVRSGTAGEEAEKKKQHEVCRDVQPGDLTHPGREGDGRYQQ